jgi:hypothetical protein
VQPFGDCNPGRGRQSRTRIHPRATAAPSEPRITVLWKSRSWPACAFAPELARDGAGWSVGSGDSFIPQLGR